MKYPWKRFWHRRGANVQLDSNGFLLDPEYEHGLYWNDHLHPLNAFSDYSFLALLGEPGAGKTTEFRDAIDFERLICEQSEDVILDCDLGAFASESRLIQAMFENSTVEEWKKGGHRLTLFFDALDEGLLDIANLSNVLSAEMRKLAIHASRLRVRITCRVADWRLGVEGAANEVWGEERVGVFELAPLRRDDVVTAAEAEGVDRVTFLNEIHSLDLEPFAMNPVSLGFLIGIYRRHGRLPSSKQELYEQGCRHLCAESNQGRRDRADADHLPTDHALAIAGRIAAVSVFCGKTMFDIGRESAVNESIATVAGLSGGIEGEGADSFNVTEKMIRKTLGTKLFNGRGEQLLGFGHRTYAEYLAARYVANDRLSLPQQKSLVFHPEMTDQVVPQLAETAAWLAVESKEVFNLLLAENPRVLLTSDAATLTDESKANIVASLIDELKLGKNDDGGWASRDYYNKLVHPGLAAQLLPFVNDKSANAMLRRFAFDVAEQCRLVEMTDALLAIVLDKSDSPIARHEAAQAFVAANENPERLDELLPLARGMAGDDPDDDLRGLALSALWKARRIDAEHIFGKCLTEPNNDSYYGEYSAFRERELLPILDVKELPIAIDWCCQHGRFRTSTHAFDSLAKSIIEQGFQSLAEPAIRVSMARFVLSRLTPIDEVPVSADVVNSLQTDVRRDLALQVIEQLENRDGAFSTLCHVCPGLVQTKDILWCIERIDHATTPEERIAWSEIAYRLQWREPHPYRDELIRCCDRNQESASVFFPIFGQVILKSKTAENLKKEYQESLKWERKYARRTARSKKPITPPPLQRVQACLKRFESGDLNAFWHLNQEMQLTETDRKDLDFNDDLTTFPGWEGVDDPTRSRILLAAEKYLVEWQPSLDEWKSTKVVFYPDFAGYRALVLLDKLSPEKFAKLSSKHWEKLAPVIFRFPAYSAMHAESEARLARLLSVAYRYCPSSVINQLLSRIDFRNHCNDGSSLRELRHLAECWDSRLVNALVDRLRGVGIDRRYNEKGKVKRSLQHCPYRSRRKARPSSSTISRFGFRKSVSKHRRKLRPNLVGDILDALLARSCDEAFDFAYLLLRHRTSYRGRSLARIAAVSLWNHASDRGLSKLIQIFKTDRHFFREIMLRVCRSHRPSSDAEHRIPEREVAELFLLLANEFPYVDLPESLKARQLSDIDSVERLRDKQINALRFRGTRESYNQILRISCEMPSLSFLSWTLQAAKKEYMKASWIPMDLTELRRLTESRTNRLVRSERELLTVVHESLMRLQAKLKGETPAIRDLWDLSIEDGAKTSKGASNATAKSNKPKREWRPVDENDFSDYVARHLRHDLEECGIVSLREVEIRRGRTEPGHRTDIYVAAIIESSDSGRHENIRLMIEVKGCWHVELNEAMETQLRDRYLAMNGCEIGIYLVGWFVCNAWTKKDSRKKKTPKLSLQAARQMLTDQALTLSNVDRHLSAIVLDLAIT